MSIGRRRNNHWKRWAALVAIAVFLGMSLRFPNVGIFLRNGFHQIMEPIEEGLHFAGSSISEVFSFMGQLFSLKEENLKLIKENDRLNRQLLQSYELQEENYRLAEMLAYKRNHSELMLYPAQVVGREGSYQNFFLVLNQGIEAGIKKEMPVLDSRGLLGIVRESWDGGSRVQLIKDSNFAVGALVQRTGSRTIGVLEGNTEHPNTPRLINLPNDADIQVGDEIITSGLGGLYPKGLLIGRVVSIHKDEGGLLKAAWIEPAARLNKVEEVFILIDVDHSEGLKNE